MCGEDRETRAQGMGLDVTDEERLYILIHVNRLRAKEGTYQ